jgi:hypothetical protein
LKGRRREGRRGKRGRGVRVEKNICMNYNSEYRQINSSHFTEVRVSALDKTWRIRKKKKKKKKKAKTKSAFFAFYFRSAFALRECNIPRPEDM